MKLKVWKYPVFKGVSPVVLPRKAHVLSGGWQQDTLFIWALVDTEETEKERRLFLTAGTGTEDLEKVKNADRLIFLGTSQHPTENLVVHFFEVINDD